MAFLSSLNISGSALTAQKFRMDVIASNIANASTTRTEEGGPYLRKMVVFQEQENAFGDFLSAAAGQAGGVEVSAVIEDQEALKMVYDPSHPDADANGYVQMPDINIVQEMTDMMSATRSYEANVTVFNAIKLMATEALEIGR